MDRKKGRPSDEGRPFGFLSDHCLMTKVATKVVPWKLP